MVQVYLNCPISSMCSQQFILPLLLSFFVVVGFNIEIQLYWLKFTTVSQVTVLNVTELK